MCLDVRDPASAMHVASDYGNLSSLNGDSIKSFDSGEWFHILQGLVFVSRACRNLRERNFLYQPVLHECRG